MAQRKVNGANNINQANSATQAKVAENTIRAIGGKTNSSSSGINRSTPVVVMSVDNTRVNLPIIRGL